jgi:hypothetical protein
MTRAQVKRQLEALAMMRPLPPDLGLKIVAAANGGPPVDDDTLTTLVGLGLLGLYLYLTTPADAGSSPPAAGPGPTIQPVQPPTPIAPVPIDPASIQVVNSPADAFSYPIVSDIRSVQVGAQLNIDFDQTSFPVVVPPGFASGITGTVWAILNINGQWWASGFIMFYPGVQDYGGGFDNMQANWWYSSRWGPMAGHRFSPGEQMGLCITGGACRDNTGPFAAVRTNIVLLTVGSSGF